MHVQTHGFCPLATIPVRIDPSDKSEMVNQLLFGELYKILEHKKKWIRIRALYDGYTGWIDIKQHCPIPTKCAKQITVDDIKIVTNLTSTILFNGEKLTILIGSVLSLIIERKYCPDLATFAGESKRLREIRDPKFIIQVAKMYLGAPYLWGGRSPFGIDCSGLTQMTFKINGYILPRDAQDQALKGDPVELDHVQSADLAFFSSEVNSSQVTHVGILMNDKEIIHASGKVRIDKWDKIGIFNTDLNKYTHFLRFARKIT